MKVLRLSDWHTGEVYDFLAFYQTPGLGVKGADNQWVLKKEGKGRKGGNKAQQKPFSLGREQRNGQPSKAKTFLAKNCSTQTKRNKSTLPPIPSKSSMQSLYFTCFGIRTRYFYTSVVLSKEANGEDGIHPG